MPQLHLVDTAGTEQFTGIDESYIQVRIALKDGCVVHWLILLWYDLQRGVGFVLVFRWGKPIDSRGA